MARSTGSRSEAPIAELVASLSIEQLREVVSSAADRHGDVARAARLVAARADDDLAALRAEVDSGLRTRRFLPYRESSVWAHSARPIVEELRRRATSSPSQELVELLQRAIGHVVKVMLHADDSDGSIGDLVRELLEVHATACDARVADPVKLARWMIRFRLEDQDIFEVDPVRYAAALGEHGLAAYRDMLDGEPPDAFAVRYACERLAVLDGDIDTIVQLAGGNLSNAYQFFRVAEAMAELGRDDLVLDWTARGIAETNGWQTGPLYDLACETYSRRGEPLEVLRLRRSQHERTPSSSTYSALRRAAEAVDAWEVERDAARVPLREHARGAFVDALLSDGDAKLAWDIAQDTADDELGADRWLRLAESRESDSPAEAVAVYERVIDEILQKTDRRAYSAAVRILKRAREAATVASELQAFGQHIATLREQHRRRPTLIAMLDKAGFR